MNVADNQAAFSSTVRYEFFQGILASWDSLFQDAADFATKIGRKD